MSDSWKTPKIRAAEKRFDRAIRSAERQVAETKRVLQEDRWSKGSREELEQMFQEHARSRDAPEPLRRLYRQIAAGELTWNDVFTGRAGADELHAAAAPHLAALDDLRERLGAGETLEDILGQDARPFERDEVERRWAASPYDVYTRRRWDPGHGRR